MKDIEQVVLRYVERYGIIEYKVDRGKLIYYQNYKETEFNGRRYISKPYTMKRIVDLKTLETTSQRLKKLQKEGWYNV